MHIDRAEKSVTNIDRACLIGWLILTEFTVQIIEEEWDCHTHLHCILASYWLPSIQTETGCADY
jgi:hypothetical protein